MGNEGASFCWPAIQAQDLWLSRHRSVLFPADKWWAVTADAVPQAKGGMHKQATREATLYYNEDRFAFFFLGRHADPCTRKPGLSTSATTTGSEPTPLLPILVVLTAETAKDPDPALVQTVGHETTTILCLCQEDLTLRLGDGGQEK
uniref:Uncharacterized protein n=1 Tax=Thermogemmatispora argillosa TaxID=2045280 RepID=A0A455T188_9CHLR|nr:hypothetical protein KTA_03940 [Thermogemmatispora argillosa]